MNALVLLVGLAIGSQDPEFAEFKSRVDGYVILHRTLEAHTLPRVVTPDPARILAASDALAMAIIAARPNARQGDLFTPTTVRLFRERILLALARVDTDRYLQDLYEGENFRDFRAVIHARDPHCRVPAGLPIDLLWVLPELPPELQYRIVGRDLALWDEHAAIIVDFIANALPEQSFTDE